MYKNELNFSFTTWTLSGLSSSSTTAHWPADLDWISQHSRRRWSCVCVCIFTQWNLKVHTPPCDSHHFMCVSALYHFHKLSVSVKCVCVCVSRCRDDLKSLDCKAWSRSSLSPGSTCSRSPSDQGCGPEVSWASQWEKMEQVFAMPERERERERQSGGMEISQLMTSCILQIQQHYPNHKKETEYHISNSPWNSAASKHQLAV